MTRALTGPSLVLQFRADVSPRNLSNVDARLESPWGTVVVPDATPGLRTALEVLSANGATEDELADLVLDKDAPSALAALFYYLEQFGTLGALRYTLVAGGAAVATVIPMAGSVQLRTRTSNPDARYRLSRFAYWRRDGTALALESPLFPARTLLHGRHGAAILAGLTQPCSYRELCASTSELDEESVQALLGLLTSVAVVAEVSTEMNLAEDDEPALAPWEFHDLLFHSRSRLGRHDYAVGGTFRFRGKLDPLPAVKPRSSTSAISLHRPEVVDLERTDPSFTHVVETRKSLRTYGSRPITVTQLGEFLYRVARVRRVAEADPDAGAHHQTSSRPYPSGGAAYDLEVYVTVHECEGIPRGLYHYDPLDHALERLADHGAPVEALLRDAQLAVGLAGEPQILITLSSRFQRVSWKYSGIAYALTLKHVGVLYQTMYLVATAMGLAPCAVGTGNSDLFAQAIGANYYAESSVGEFLLGSGPDAG